jgi:hypothetical protein
VNADEFCRTIESYLTRKNDGHLVRIVGPSFERVRGWSETGIPLKVVFAGIDRYFDRYYAKGSRRRPVRIDFCEADVLDVFDEWRRAVGLAAGRTEVAGGDPPSRRRESLATHLERALARLVAMRSGSAPAGVPDTVLAEVVAELDRLMGGARGARGDARQSILDRLEQLDARLLSAARDAMPEDAMAVVKAEATADLKPFEERMSREVWARTFTLAVDRVIRERARLPTLAVE